MRCSLLGRMRRLATSTNARAAIGTSLDCPSDSSRIFQRPSWSNKIRTARTGPQVEASRTSGAGRSAMSRDSTPASRRWSFGSIWTKRSLRPRSATTRCLTLPFSRKASTTRTYSLTVPLLERILTVRGYMAASITTLGRHVNRKKAEIQPKLAIDCHYTFPPRDGRRACKIRTCAYALPPYLGTWDSAKYHDRHVSSCFAHLKAVCDRPGGSISPR